MRGAEDKMLTRTSTVHPLFGEDLEKGNARISKKPSYNELRPSSSCPSLSAELVEAVMYDGQYRPTSDSAQEVAIWCGLVSFLVFGLVLIGVGLYMALTLN